MALTWVSPTDDIIVQEGTLAYNFIASGTISAGQIVEVNDTMKVRVDPTANDTSWIGVAAYDVTDDEYVAIYGPGNIVRCKSSGAINVGNRVAINSLYGHVGVPEAGVTNGAEVGISLETVATNTSVRVLLL